ncbi:MAG: hypothetical protein R3B99_11470 [Polyangiales bacterium]
MHRAPGLAKARRSTLARTRGGEALTREAEEALFALSDRMTEGALATRGDDEAWFGTTMFTVPLAELEATLRGALDPARLANLVEGSVRVRLRAIRLACADVAHRHPQRRFGRSVSETQVRVADGCLQIDVDLHWPIAESGLDRAAR